MGKKEIGKGKAKDFKKECSDDPPNVRRCHAPRLCRKHIIHLYTWWFEEKIGGVSSVVWLLFSSSISWLVSLAIPVVEFVCRGMDTKKRSREKSPVADGEKTHDRKQQLVMPTQVVLCFRKNSCRNESVAAEDIKIAMHKPHSPSSSDGILNVKA